LCVKLSHLWQYLESKMLAMYLTVSRKVEIPMIRMPSPLPDDKLFLMQTACSALLTCLLAAFTSIFESIDVLVLSCSLSLYSLLHSH